MAGIAGIVGHPDASLLRRMMRTMRHRGRDALGVYGGDHAALAVCQHAHEGVDAPSAGGKSRAGGPKGGLGQPFTDGPADVRVAFDGELTNAPELRGELISEGAKFQTDIPAEVLLEAWRRHGTNCFSRLAGSFACAIWDQRIRSLVLARDPLGVRPLYTQVVDDQLRFASEIKGLRAAPDFTSSLDHFAVEDFFTWGYIPPPRTIWQTVRAVPPGHYAIWREGRLTLQRYFALHWPDTTDVRGREDWMIDLHAALDEAIARTLRDPYGAGAFEGPPEGVGAARLRFDSSPESLLTAHVVNRFGATDSVRVSSPVHVPDPWHRHDGADRAAANATGIGIEHEHTDVTMLAGAKASARSDDAVAPLATELIEHLDQPIADPMLLMQLAEWKQFRRAGSRVVIGTYGANELFGGHRRVAALMRSERVGWPLVRDLAGVVGRLVPAIDNGRVAQWLTGGDRGLPESAVVRGSFAGLSRRAVSAWRGARRYLRSLRHPVDQRYLQWLQVFTSPLAPRRLLSNAFRQSLSAHDAQREFRAAFHRLGVRRRGLVEVGNPSPAGANGGPRIGWHELAGAPARTFTDWDAPGVISGSIDSGRGPRDGRPMADCAMALDLAATFPGRTLPGIDACAALAGVTARSPFVDRQLLEWSTHLPASLKIGPQGGKRILRMALHDVAPGAAFVDHLPPDRRGLATWLMQPGHLGQEIESALTSPALASRGIVDPDSVARLRKQHASGRENLALELFALWVFEAWCRSH